MNERDIKNYFANASLSEQKKDQLKETLKQQFPQQDGDINTSAFKPEIMETHPEKVTRHMAARIAAAAAAVVLVATGGFFMAKNIHQYEPDTGTGSAECKAPNTSSEERLCSPAFMKLAGEVLDSTQPFTGSLDKIQGSPSSCDVTYGGNYDENIEGKEHSTRYYVDLLEKTDSGLPSVDFLTDDNSYETNSLVIDILSEIKTLDEDAFNKAVNCRIEAHIENNNCKITISDSDNSVSLKYGSGESFTENAKIIAQTLKNDLLDIYDESSMKNPDNAIFSYSPADYEHYSDIMSSNDITEYVKSDYAQNESVTTESLILLTLKAINNSDMAFDMTSDYFAVDMLTDSFKIYRYANDGSWEMCTATLFSRTDMSDTAMRIYEKADELVKKYNTEGRKLHFDTVNSLDLTKQLAMSYLPDLDTENDITPELFAYALWLEMLSHDREYGDLDLSKFEFSIYFEKDKDGSAYNVKSVDVTVDGYMVYSYSKGAISGN
ncbi:hypothetical protein [Ruminococcus sp.]|uniref:hypothetical protein n=1 Tax=Ruminococcus sp. TaxID=41978 RepID=UPI0025802757|nr:hypothetical protein [Ruminococcus sp.]